MGLFDRWLEILKACAPILVALVGIIPTVVSNRKKTQASIDTMMKEVTSEICSTKSEVAEVKSSMERHLAEDEEEKAKRARYRILRFYDEVCANIEHSESHWEDVLDDIDFYETFCASRQNFKNNRGGAAMEHLKETYSKVKAKGGFLTHKEMALHTEF